MQHAPVRRCIPPARGAAYGAFGHVQPDWAMAGSWGRRRIGQVGSSRRRGRRSRRASTSATLATRPMLRDRPSHGSAPNATSAARSSRPFTTTGSGRSSPPNCEAAHAARERERTHRRTPAASVCRCVITHPDCMVSWRWRDPGSVARWRRWMQDVGRSRLAVLVVTAPPDGGLVPSSRCTVEPLVHAPQDVEAARVRGVRVADDATSRRNALTPGRSRVYVGTSVPVMAAMRATGCSRSRAAASSATFRWASRTRR